MGETNWLSFAQDPATAPNTGAYFCPELQVGVTLGAAAATGVFTFFCEMEVMIECKESKV